RRYNPPLRTPPMNDARDVRWTDARERRYVTSREASGKLLVDRVPVDPAYGSPRVGVPRARATGVRSHSERPAEILGVCDVDLRRSSWYLGGREDAPAARTPRPRSPEDCAPGRRPDPAGFGTRGAR